MTSDDVLQLQQPLTAGGIRSVNFFNGRLLTGKDLTRQQQAQREADARLGLALGDGVAFGMEVAPLADTASLATGSFVTIEPGLAINRAGQLLRLENKATVALTQQTAAIDFGACVFARCTRLSGSTFVTGAGVYVLTVAPTVVAEGRAATNGLDPTNVRCNTDAHVDALQFRLLGLSRDMLSGLDIDSPTLRNELAYRCFGAGIQPAWFASLMTASPRRDDLLESLRSAGLSDQEVPLALLHFKGTKALDFVDGWAVRRPLHRAESGAMAGLVDGRRTAVGRAMFLQFQSQLGALLSPSLLPAGITAQSHFRYLPPVGVIPVAEEAGGGDRQATAFFAGMTCRRPAFMNAARVEALLRDSLHFPPIDTRSGELVWLYRIRENRLAIELTKPNPRPVSTLVFASGHIPYLADAQFDVNSWNYSNYARDTRL